MNLPDLIEGIIKEVHDIKEKPRTDEEKKQKLKDLANDTIAVLESIVSA